MVLLERIELSTSPLPMECSTSELQQRRKVTRLYEQLGNRASAIWTLFGNYVMPLDMSDKQKTIQAKNAAQARDTRLKAALKANMSRRKTQARARASDTDEKAQTGD